MMINSKEKQIDLLLEGISINKVGSSVILDRIERITINSNGASDKNCHSSHDRHCKFDKSGDGGHASICYRSDEDTKDLIGDSDEG